MAGNSIESLNTEESWDPWGSTQTVQMSSKASEHVLGVAMTGLVKLIVSVMSSKSTLQMPAEPVTKPGVITVIAEGIVYAVHQFFFAKLDIFRS